MNGLKNMIYTCNKTLFSLNKEGHFDICYNMDEPEDITLCEISQSQNDKYCIISLT